MATLYSSPNTIVTINRSNITQNQAVLAGGGCFFVRSLIKFKFLTEGAYISKNTAAVSGGGVYFISSQVKLFSYLQAEYTNANNITDLFIKDNYLWLNKSNVNVESFPETFQVGFSTGQKNSTFLGDQVQLQISLFDMFNNNVTFNKQIMQLGMQRDGNVISKIDVSSQYLNLVLLGAGTTGDIATQDRNLMFFIYSKHVFPYEKTTQLSIHMEDCPPFYSQQEKGGGSMQF